MLHLESLNQHQFLVDFPVQDEEYYLKNNHVAQLMTPQISIVISQHLWFLHHFACPMNETWCIQCVVTPFWGKCEDEIHTPKSGNLESSGIPETSELDCRGQNTSSWGVLYTVGKVLKCKCRKWPRMSHSHIWNTSYGRKKGRESNWQFDSRPLKVGNRLDPGVCRWSATHCWKALEERYKFSLDLISIGGLSWELWASGVQTRTISGLFLGSLGTKSHSDVGAMEQRKEYYMGEGGGFPQVWAMVN